MSKELSFELIINKAIPTVVATAVFIFSNFAIARIDTEMHFYTDSFVSQNYSATEKTYYQYLGVKAESDHFKQDTLVIDIESGYAVGAPLLSYLNISEFYFNIQRDSETDPQFTFGRRKFKWSRIDDDWSLGLWEPVFKSNPLNTSSQGLLGAFMDHRIGPFKMMLFASPLYLPSQGPNFQISNGAFVPGNPWFRKPPENFVFSSEVSKIDYQIERPKDSQIVFQTSVGGQFGVDLTSQQQLQLTHIYKPMNDLGLAYNAIMDISKDKAIVSINPQVMYHTLTSVEYLGEFENFELVGHFALDRPKNESVVWSDNWTHPVYKDAQIISESIEYKLFTNHRLGLKNMNILNGQVVEIGEWADSQRPSITTRYPFTQASEVYIKNNWKLGNREWIHSSLSYMWSVKNQFELLKWKLKYSVAKRWYLEMNMIFVDANELSVSNYNSISEYKNNDQVALGVVYVF